MKRLRSKQSHAKAVAMLVTGALVASLALVGSASAATVTVGSTANPTGETAVGNPATIFNTTLSTPGNNLTSPISGTVIRWHLTGFSGGPWSLQVLTPNGGLSFTSTGTSTPQTPASKATQTFSTNLPIKAGQMLALKNTNATDKLGQLPAPAGKYAFFVPPLAEGATGNATEGTASEWTYNAEVQPLPTITSLAPSSGPTTGGTSVTITGSDLTGATGVTFGGTAATSFSVGSDTTITAAAPARSTAGAVPVVVTTLAGASNGSTQYTYAAPAPPAPTCTVPKLRGKTLKAAKKRIRGAECRVGKLTKRRGATARNGEVVQQVPKAGTVVPAETQVKVTLAP